MIVQTLNSSRDVQEPIIALRYEWDRNPQVFLNCLVGKMHKRVFNVHQCPKRPHFSLWRTHTCSNFEQNKPFLQQLKIPARNIFCSSAHLAFHVVISVSFRIIQMHQDLYLLRTTWHFSKQCIISYDVKCLYFLAVVKQSRSPFIVITQ